MRIWLDDERDPTTEFIQHWFGAKGNERWIKTAEELIPIIKTGEITFISFDHDLGIGLSGYDAAKIIEEEAYYSRIPKIQWRVHSANHVGAQRIAMAMKSADAYWNRCQ